jgi:hypothetical protein
MARRTIPINVDNPVEPSAEMGQPLSVTRSRDWIDRVSAPTAENGALSVVLERLASLLDEDETDDYGVLSPSEYAFTTTWNLLVAAAREMSCSFPRAAVSTDSEGGIRVQWIRPERQVRLVIPTVEGKRHYIYHEEGDQYDVEPSVSATTLARWLSWLAEHD